MTDTRVFNAEETNRRKALAKERAKEAMQRRLPEFERRYAEQLSGHTREGAMIEHALKAGAEEGNLAFIKSLQNMKRTPPTILEVLESDEFLGDVLNVWPALREDLILMNPDIILGEQPINEVVLGGATSTGKTFLSHVTTIYDIVFLSCFRSPQLLFPSISRVTPIVFMMQSVSQHITDRVIYKPLKHMIDEMPYTKKNIAYDKRRESAMLMDNGIQVIQGLATEQAIVGQAIIGGILDEVNFMSVVSKSAKVAGARGAGGHYDQAEIVHKSITRRRKSRFATAGLAAGKLCVISSTRYKGDFIDKRIKQVEANKEDNVFVSRRKQYEVQPAEGRYKGDKFKLLIGNDRYPTQVIKATDVEGVHYPKGGTIELVPTEYLADFMNDPENALRDVLGVSTDTLTPFIPQRNKIIDAVTRWQDMELKPWAGRQNVILADHGMPQIIKENLPKDRSKPRFVHVDLSATKDRCGIAISKILGHQLVEIENGVYENLPVFMVECAVSIQPDTLNELDIAAVRQWVMNLQSYYGFEIRCVSYDGFDSRESRQLLRKAGINSKLISLDRTSEPYKLLKGTFYQDRIIMCDNELAIQELGALEYHADKDRIDHSPKLSKDLSDAICGSVFNAATSRLTRGDVAVVDEDGERITRRQRPRARSGRRETKPNRR